jgi:hypothetical protein
LDRESENLTSFSTGISNCSASSYRLCHAPSLMVPKNFSLLKFVH